MLSNVNDDKGVQRIKSIEECEARLHLSIHQLERRLLETQKRGDLPQESALCNKLAKKHEQLGQLSRALEYHLYDKQICRTLDDDDGQLLALSNMASVFIQMRQLEEAERIMKEQLSLALKIQNMPGAFLAYSALGNALLDYDYISLQEQQLPFLASQVLQQAASYFNRGHECIDSYGAMIDAGILAPKRRKELDQLRNKGRVNDARIVAKKGQWDLAEGKLLLAIEEARRVNDLSFEYAILQHLADIYAARGQWKEALEECYDRQSAIAKEQGDPSMASETLVNMSTACVRLGDLDLAEKSLFLAKDTLQLQVFDGVRIAEVEAMIQRVQHTAMIQNKIEALEAKLDDSQFENTERVYRKLTDLYTEMNDFKEALRYAKLYLELLLETSPHVSLLADSFKKVALLSAETKARDDAIFYSRKHLEALEHVFTEDRSEIVEALLLLVKAELPLPDEVLSASVIRDAKQALVISQRLKDPELELRCLDALSLAHSRRCPSDLGDAFAGIIDDGEEERDLNECKSLHEARRLALPKSKEIQKMLTDLEKMDYFVNRKASKNVMRFVDGQFSMKSRAKGTKGLVIRKSRKPIIISDDDLSPPMKSRNLTLSRKNASPPKTDSKRRKRRVVFESDDDLGDFIINEPISRHDAPSSGPKDKSPLHQAGEMPFPESYDDFPIKELQWSPSPELKTSANALTVANGSIPKTSKTPDFSTSQWRPRPVDEFIASIIRINVSIQNELLVIPVVDDIAERKTIAWLMEQTAQRYKELFGKEPIIEALQTVQGARLFPNDHIYLILGDEQTVSAVTTAWRVKSLGELLADNDSIQVSEWISLDGKDLDLSFWTGSRGSLVKILNAYRDYIASGGATSRLNLSNNLLVDNSILGLILPERRGEPPRTDGKEWQEEDLKINYLNLSFTSISSVEGLNKLSLIQCLDLSFCPIAPHCLNAFLFPLSHDPMPLEQLILRGLNLVSVDLSSLPLLSPLSLLDLSFSILDSRTVDSIGTLLKRSSTLTELHLYGCVKGEPLEGDENSPLDGEIDWEPVTAALQYNFSLVCLGGITVDTEALKERNPRTMLK